MASLRNFLVFITILHLFSVLQTPAFAVKRSYIVYLGGHSHGPELKLADADRGVLHSHHQFLGTFLGSVEKAKEAITYSYKRHINGFSAFLEDKDATEIAKHPNVVSVFLDRGKELHTTHSWDFVLLENNGVIPPKSLWNKAKFGEDVIIGNLDSGVWPESKSFSDEGYGPVPAKWNGRCHKNVGITCNKKLIGARYFNNGYRKHAGKSKAQLRTARDYEGHGTHTLSTAGGNFVPGANVFGLGNGTAKGGSPRARVAAYKVCWPDIEGEGGCFDSDILKGFDKAIDDGVDVLSVSLGGENSDYFSDGIAIGAFHAVVKNGMVVVCSAGNSGPDYATVSNVAPWMITVGASTDDRGFPAYVKLNNGQLLKGTSLSKPMADDKFYPLIDGANAKAANSSANEAKFCKAGSLDPEKVKGKILVCLRGVTARVDKGEQALLAGAVGMILCNDKGDGNGLVADANVLPASNINYTDGLAVYAYLNSTKNPTGYLKPPHTSLGTKSAPFMAPFSSRGPNTVTPEILKPDITAPGVDIVAAYSEGTSPTGLASDKRKTPFNLLSGTSMSCPHVSGVVGLLKALHPDWSAAAIRSAIMTTARTRANTEKPMIDGATNLEATPFDYGAGHIRPNSAMDPGLVYDLSEKDYLDFLCASGYNSTTFKQFSSDYKCPKDGDSLSLLNFNYPSITIPNLTDVVTVTRSLKNVGAPGTYTARVRQPLGISVVVEPSTITFAKIGEVKSFKMQLEAKWCDTKINDYVFGELIWSDGKHYVRSPISVATKTANIEYTTT